MPASAAFRVRAGLLALAACGFGACSTSPRQPPAAPQLRTAIEFKCLWWSSAEMVGINPNAPPPKTTETRIAKWEYSDPVGVPHPDTVDIVIALDNSGAPLRELEVAATGQWRTGPLHNESGAGWSEPFAFQTFNGVSVVAPETKTLRIPVDLKARMDSLERQGAWPYALRVSVSVRVRGTGNPVAQATAELPIRPGD